MKTSFILVVYFLCILSSFKLLASNAFGYDLTKEQRMTSLAMTQKHNIQVQLAAAKLGNSDNKMTQFEFILAQKIYLIDLFLMKKVTHEEFEMAFGGLDGDPY